MGQSMIYLQIKVSSFFEVEYQTKLFAKMLLRNWTHCSALGLALVASLSTDFSATTVQARRMTSLLLTLWWRPTARR